MLTAFLMACVTLYGSPGQGSLPTPAARVQAVGIGYPPPRMPGAQGRLMARRAAEVVAVRNLAVKLGVGPHGRLPSFRYVSTKHLPNGSVEVTVETTVPVGRNTTASPTTKNGVRPRRQVGGRP
ncbi:MAG: hypothetical protein AAB363_00555 [Planctomycetota bacterium]